MQKGIKPDGLKPADASGPAQGPGASAGPWPPPEGQAAPPQHLPRSLGRAGAGVLAGPSCISKPNRNNCHGARAAAGKEKPLGTEGSQSAGLRLHGALSSPTRSHMRLTRVTTCPKASRGKPSRPGPEGARHPHPGAARRRHDTPGTPIGCPRRHRNKRLGGGCGQPASPYLTRPRGGSAL